MGRSVRDGEASELVSAWVGTDPGELDRTSLFQGVLYPFSHPSQNGLESNGSAWNSLANLFHDGTRVPDDGYGKWWCENRCEGSEPGNHSYVRGTVSVRVLRRGGARGSVPKKEPAMRDTFVLVIQTDPSCPKCIAFLSATKE
jgi:hypothetical protein